MAVEFRTPDPVTEEMLLGLSELNPGWEFERTASGELVVTPPVGVPGGFGEMELGGQLWAWNKARGLGMVSSSSTGMTLPDTSINVPDAAFLSHERLKAMSASDRARAFYLVCPDAAFELVSPSNSLPAIDRKLRGYIENGARLAVKIDPLKRTVTILRASQPPQTLINPDTIAFDPELPGFELNVRAIFDAIDGVR